MAASSEGRVPGALMIRINVAFVNAAVALPVPMTVRLGGDIGKTKCIHPDCAGRKAPKLVTA